VRTVVSTDATQTLSNKTLTGATLTGATLTGTTRVGFADQSTDPAAAGDFQRRGADLKWHDGTAVRTVVSTDATQTLANKTLSVTAKVGFADQGADPTSAGTLQRNGNRLKWHTGTTVETLAYVSEISTGGGVFPAGTRMVFDQDTPPAGWTRDTAIDDRVVRIVGGARTHGGSWTISGLTSPAHQHDMGNHTHNGPLHTHNIATGPPTERSGIRVVVAGGMMWTESSDTGNAANVATNNTTAAGTGATSGPSTNLTSSVSVTISSDGSWRPLSRDMIVASKD
jgi:hypothetical protein